MRLNFEFSGVTDGRETAGESGVETNKFHYFIAAIDSSRSVISRLPATNSPRYAGESVTAEGPNTNDEDRADIIARVRFFRGLNYGTRALLG